MLFPTFKTDPIDLKLENDRKGRSWQQVVSPPPRGVHMPNWLPLSQLESATFFPGILVESATFFQWNPRNPLESQVFFYGIPESWNMMTIFATKNVHLGVSSARCSIFKWSLQALLMIADSENFTSVFCLSKRCIYSISCR